VLSDLSSFMVIIHIHLDFFGSFLLRKIIAEPRCFVYGDAGQMGRRKKTSEVEKGVTGGAIRYININEWCAKGSFVHEAPILTQEKPEAEQKKSRGKAECARKAIRLFFSCHTGCLWGVLPIEKAGFGPLLFSVVMHIFPFPRRASLRESGIFSTPSSSGRGLTE